MRLLSLSFALLVAVASIGKTAYRASAGSVNCIELVRTCLDPLIEGTRALEACKLEPHADQLFVQYKKFMGTVTRVADHCNLLLVPMPSAKEIAEKCTKTSEIFRNLVLQCGR